MTDTNDSTGEADMAKQPPTEDTADKRITDREEAAFARAADADTRISPADKVSKHFADWLAIGAGLAALRDRALRQSFSNGPFGKDYTRTYKRLKDAHPWAGHYDSGTTSYCVWLHDHAIEVLQWRETIGDKERQQWITPKINKQHYEAATVAKQKRAAGIVSLSPMARAQQTISEVQAENDRLKRELAKADAGSLFDLRTDTAPMIARVIVNSATDYKAEAIHKALGEAIKAQRAKRKQPAG